jgi:hypothetical protein
MWELRRARKGESGEISSEDNLVTSSTAWESGSLSTDEAEKLTHDSSNAKLNAVMWLVHHSKNERCTGIFTERVAFELPRVVLAAHSRFLLCPESSPFETVLV